MTIFTRPIGPVFHEKTEITRPKLTFGLRSWENDGDQGEVVLSNLYHAQQFAAALTQEIAEWSAYERAQQLIAERDQQS